MHTKCSICIHNTPDGYNKSQTMCDVCESFNQFKQRKKEEHPCLKCEFIQSARHACPCDILCAYTEVYFIDSQGKRKKTLSKLCGVDFVKQMGVE